MISACPVFPECLIGGGGFEEMLGASEGVAIMPGRPRAWLRWAMVVCVESI